MNNIKPLSNLLELFKFLMAKSNFGTPNFPVKYNLVEENSPKLIVFLGDNGSGKSLLTTQMTAMAKKIHNVSGYSMSMHTRTKEGNFKVFMYEPEEDNSTGVITVSAVMQGVNHCFSNAKKGSDMMLLLDEPTLGLSSRYERAMGKYLVDNIKENEGNEHFKGVLLVTHSKDMVREIVESGYLPSLVSVNNERTLKEWLDDNSSATVEELLSLKKTGLERWREVNNYFKNQ